MKNKQRATITSINDFNKSFEVKITNCQAALEADESVNVLIPMLSAKLGDGIEFNEQESSDFEIVNLTCETLRLSKFKRDLTSVLRRLDCDIHPLKRYNLFNEAGFVLLSAKKNAKKLMLLMKQTNN